jgi:hypothetical protein
MVLVVLVTAASMRDRDAGLRLLANLREAFPTIQLVWADAGYRGRLPRWAKRVLNLPMQIIKRLPGSSGFHVRPWVRITERTFGWISKHRRCVRDYETSTDHQEAMLHLAMTRTTLRRLTRTRQALGCALSEHAALGPASGWCRTSPTSTASWIPMPRRCR